MSPTYLGIDVPFLHPMDQELLRRHQMGEAVILPDELTRLREAASKEKARREAIEDTCALAQSILLASLSGAHPAPTLDCFKIAEDFVSECQKRRDWK